MKHRVSILQNITQNALNVHLKWCIQNLMSSDILHHCRGTLHLSRYVGHPIKGGTYSLKNEPSISVSTLSGATCNTIGTKIAYVG